MNGGERATRQLVRFIIAGTLNTSVSYGIYALGLWLGTGYALANLLSMIGGVLIGFVTQGAFVFRRFETRRFPLFIAVWLALWVVNVLLIRLLLPSVNQNAYVSGALTLLVMVPLSFIVQKFLVFGDGSGR